jgi:hypothetical protein
MAPRPDSGSGAAYPVSLMAAMGACGELFNGSYSTVARRIIRFD